MTDNTRFRQLWFAILGLLIINLGMLLWMWLSASSPIGKPSGPPMLTVLVEKLGFDQQQKTQLDVLVKRHFAEVDPIRDSVRILKDQLFKQLPNTALSNSQLDSICGVIAQKMAQTDQMVFRHFQEIRALCTPEQQQKFDRIIQDLLHQQGRRGMPPPPPPRRL
jgi:hypothetical protein